MVVTKPADFRMNQKDYFQKAYDGEPVIVSRPGNENVIIISANEYNEMQTIARLSAYKEGLSELYARAIKMEEEKDLSKQKLLSFYKDVLNLAKKGAKELFTPLSKEEFIEKLEKAKKSAEEGKTIPAHQLYEEMRELYGI